MATSRDALPLRFKNPRTKEALRELSAQTGASMTDIAEKAVEHELALLGADLERRLVAALDVVQSYTPEVDLEAYLAEVAVGERSGLEPVRSVRARHLDDRFGVLAAFRQG
ncbi:type II toxin-antitoxin system VapB family antitoxin [Rhodococcus antarcticus]|uniref:Type II toxin-antitoxin system VapB family antitoxin n=1 Tax=Rhodococcus antarcticus TaxID=2987751 RepID=A0ABY6NZN2_9NOCA|nr:type II toxin-antitoxin system VapB family antitoxin [Rhodococcus antarcticus]UZJ24879.1 type II toxin-antitoxin system VapB family antitoxin [Rhodococcus antarcticus]